MSTPVSIEEAISTGLALAKRHFKPLASAALLIMAVAVAFQILMPLLGISELEDGSTTWPDSLAQAIGATVAIIIYVVVMIILSTGIMAFALQLVSGKPASLATVYKPGIKVVARYIWASIAYGLILLGVMVACLVPILLLYAILAALGALSGGGAIALAIIGGISVIALIGSLIFGSTRLFLSPLIAIDQELSAKPAIKQSWENTRGNFWRIIAIWLIVTIVMMLITIIPNVIALILTAMGPGGSIVGVIINAIVMILVIPFPIMINVVLYRRLAGGTVHVPPAATKA